MYLITPGLIAELTCTLLVSETHLRHDYATNKLSNTYINPFVLHYRSCVTLTLELPLPPYHNAT